MFEYKTQKEIADLTDEQAEVYAKELKAHEIKVRKTEIEAATKVLSDELATVKTASGELQEQINVLKEVAKTQAPTEILLVDELKTNKDALIAISKGGKGEIQLKALSNRASIDPNLNYLPLAEITQLGVKRRSLYDVLPKIQVSVGNHNGVIKYRDWDEDTTVRAAAMVAEGAPFPESTAKFKDYTQPLQKIGDTLPVTEEFFEDEAQAAGELRMFLETNVNTVIDNQLVNGPGTGITLLGLVASSPAFVPAASGIAGANIYDLVKKVRTAIVFNRGSKYSPDIVLMNANTLDRLQLDKDLNNNYTFKDVDSIGSMIIVEDNNMADNVLIVGDRRYARIYEMGGVVISEGYKGDQFVEDEMTLKARKRMLLLVKNGDRTGFLKVTNITTALATLAS
jgi:HK97 family phage major capsid protein